MTRFVCSLGSALAISGAALAGQAQVSAPSSNVTVVLTDKGSGGANDLLDDVKTLGCIRVWKPAPDDPTKMPPDRQPGVAGVYLLTPLASSGSVSIDLPTYLLTPSATLTFSQHVGHQVEIVGTAQAAPPSPPVDVVATAPVLRPENKPSTDGMPRLTVTTMKMVGESCP